MPLDAGVKPGHDYSKELVKATGARTWLSGGTRRGT